MERISNEEAKILREFLRIPIPAYIRTYERGEFDLMDCYEIGFTFAIDLLRGKKINPDASPWGDGKSVIFSRDYEKVLLDIQNTNLNKSVSDYCACFLKALNVLKSHFE